MKNKKKSPYELYKQLTYIMNYLMCDSWKDGRPSKEVRNKVLEKVNKVKSIFDRYVDNIYKLHNVDRWRGNVKESNDIWFNGHHTKEEYMNI